MKRQIDLSVGFTASVFLHGMIMVCVACVWPANHSGIIPNFQTGESSLTLTLPASPQVDPEPVEMKSAHPDHEETIRTEIVEMDPDYSEPALDENPEKAIYPDADMLTKGVTGNARSESQIRPYYPLGSRLRGEQGRVTLAVTVNQSGKAQRIEVIQSSEYRALNRAAIQAVERARFIPARHNGMPTESGTTLTFRFELVE